MKTLPGIDNFIDHFVAKITVHHQTTAMCHFFGHVLNLLNFIF